MPKTIYEYEREFLHKFDDKKGKVTKEMYQKELLKFVKTMDTKVLLDNYSKFINETADDITRKWDYGEVYAKDKNMYPYQMFEGLLINSRYPSEKYMNAIKAGIKAEGYTEYCNELINKEFPGSKDNQITEKLNKLKVIHALKPGGNAFLDFFRKLFNIGGYNDKIAAYNECYNSVREFVGDKMTDREFSDALNDKYNPFKGSLKKDKLVQNKEKLIIDDKEIVNEVAKEKEIVIENDVPEIQINLEKKI